MGGQTLDLLDVKDRVALHEGDCTVDFLAGFIIGFLARDDIAYTTREPLLALVDMRVQL